MDYAHHVVPGPARVMIQAAWDRARQAERERNLLIEMAVAMAGGDTRSEAWFYDQDTGELERREPAAAQGAQADTPDPDPPDPDEG